MVGALASSAVVKAAVAFEDYDRMVAQGLGAECLNAMQAATRQIEESLSHPDELRKLEELFNVANLDRDPRRLLAIASYTADGAVQYGYQEGFCEVVLSEKEPIQGLAKAMRQVSATSRRRGQMDGYSWLYQKCTQFGGFVVANHDPALRVMSPLLDLKYFMQPCQDIFNITLAPAVDELNRSFYEPLLDPATSNIVYVNGAMDPYSTLSIIPENGNNTKPNTEAYVIAGGSHCVDFYYFLQPLPGLPQAVTEFQEHFLAIAKKWLE